MYICVCVCVSKALTTRPHNLSFLVLPHSGCSTLPRSSPFTQVT